MPQWQALTVSGKQFLLGLRSRERWTARLYLEEEDAGWSIKGLEEQAGWSIKGLQE